MGLVDSFVFSALETFLLYLIAMPFVSANVCSVSRVCDSSSAFVIYSSIKRIIRELSIDIAKEKRIYIERECVQRHRISRALLCHGRSRTAHSSFVNKETP